MLLISPLFLRRMRACVCLRSHPPSHQFPPFFPFGKRRVLCCIVSVQRTSRENSPVCFPLFLFSSLRVWVGSPLLIAAVAVACMSCLCTHILCKLGAENKGKEEEEEEEEEEQLGPQPLPNSPDSLAFTNADELTHNKRHSKRFPLIFLNVF